MSTNRRDVLLHAEQASRPVTIGPELKWAWRGVRARGWRAVFVIALLGAALAANAIVFASADAFVFRILPYHQPSRLVVIERIVGGVTDIIAPEILREWRKHADLFAGVHGHTSAAGAYVTVAGITEVVRVERVTPGVFELLGVMPKWGRPFVSADAPKEAPPVAIIGESLARRLFPDPSAAIHEKLFTGSETLMIIGVMPASFRFPTAREEIWRPLDLDTQPSNIGLRNVARLASGQTLESAARNVADRRWTVAQAGDPRFGSEQIRLRAMSEARGNTAAATVVTVLVGAAGCLMLIACANVASLELAASTKRVRAYAVQTALGASRASLLRVALLEGIVLVTASAAFGLALSHWGTAFMDGQLTATMRAALTNPIDVDPRVVAFTLAVMFGAWLLTVLLPLWQISRFPVMTNLRDDPRTIPIGRGATRSRQFVVAGQVALTTVLLVGALMYLRSYLAQTGLDKGFDATNIATIEVFAAPDAPRRDADLESAVLGRLQATPWIRAVSRTDTLPPDTQGGGAARLSIEGRERTIERIMIHMRDVDPEYFETMGMTVLEGRAFDGATPRDQILVDERFARRYWPGTSPLGARFRLGGGSGMGLGGVSNFQIAGVTRQLRSDRIVTEEGEEVYVAHIRIAPTYHPLMFVARVDDEDRLADLIAIVRSVAERSVVRVDTVNARYARLYAHTQLAAAVTSSFGLVALGIAAAGIYAVVAYVVAGRSKEIAIRMALGADHRGVRNLICRFSLGPIAIGGGMGLVTAAVGSRWLSRQLPGVGVPEPTNFVGAVALLSLAAVLATWWPARRASHVDPAVTLRRD